MLTKKKIYIYIIYHINIELSNKSKFVLNSSLNIRRSDFQNFPGQIRVDLGTPF